MRKLSIFKCFVMVLAFCYMNANAQTYQMVWSDEFNYTGLPDASKWSFEDWAPKAVNNELQRYVPNRLENCRAENGMLIIEARRDWYNGSEYSSARIHSSKKGFWTYGRMEARMRVPGGYGTWPAFWMMPEDWTKYGINPETNSYWPNCGEIDIMEYVGYDKGNIHGSVHSSKYYFKKGNQRTGIVNVPDAETAFHVYAIEWSADKIDFFVDNNKYFTVFNDGTGWESYPFNYDFHIIFNLAVGGDWGGAMGVDPNIWPRRLEIDYVRVYKQTPCAVTSLPAKIEAEKYCQMSGIQLENTSDTGGGQNVGYIDTNDWMSYKVNVPSSGTYTVQYRVASANGGGSIRLEKLGGGATYGTINVPSTGGWQNWQTISHNVQLSAGQQDIAIAAAAGGFNVNWINITGGSPGFSQTVQAESYSEMFGIQTETTGDAGGGLNVGWIDTNDWLKYNNITVPSTGSYKFEYRVASPNSTGILSQDLNSGSIQLGTVNIPNTGGWQNWTTISKTVTLNAGTYNFGIFAKAGGWNINWWRLSSATGARIASSEESTASGANDLSVFPNPSSGSVTIRVAEPSDVTILDVSGKSHLSTFVESSITVDYLNSGLYIVKMKNQKKSANTKLLIK